MGRKMTTIGDRFGNLIVIELAGKYTEPRGKIRKLWRCRCDCGNIVDVKSVSLRDVSACKQCIKQRKHNFWKTKDRKLETIHRSRYDHMIARCYDPSEVGYKNYGERGITVCDRWIGDNGLSNFCEDMGNCPEHHTLDRIDVNGDYEPENCRWASRSLQGFNTRRLKTNTSGRTGVYWFNRVGKWIAAIVVNGKQIHLGYFINFEDAVEAREKAEIKYFGELHLDGK